MIDTIYEEIRLKLLALKLKEAKEYFDFDNIPDSLTDNTFIISPIEFDPGDSIKTASKTVVIGLESGIKVSYAVRLPANEIINKLKRTMVMLENILKAILSITVGSDEKDVLDFAGSPYRLDGDKLIYEINFNLDYRINNL